MSVEANKPPMQKLGRKANPVKSSSTQDNGTRILPPTVPAAIAQKIPKINDFFVVVSNGTLGLLTLELPPTSRSFGNK